MRRLRSAGRLLGFVDRSGCKFIAAEAGMTLIASGN
jgi:hypothetical protein